MLNKPSCHTVLIAAAFCCILTYHARAETEVSGRVVEYNTNSGLSNITVKIRATPQGAPDATTTTNSDGNYSLRISSDPARYFVTYDVPSGSDHDPAGRDNIVRMGPRVALDTVGLTNKRSTDRSAATAHAYNTRGYVAAGGDANTAAVAVRDAFSRFGSEYRAIGQQLGLGSVLQSRGIPF